MKPYRVQPDKCVIRAIMEREGIVNLAPEEAELATQTR
jgi:hypothetical protein